MPRRLSTEEAQDAATLLAEYCTLLAAYRTRFRRSGLDDLELYADVEDQLTVFGEDGGVVLRCPDAQRAMVRILTSDDSTIEPGEAYWEQRTDDVRDLMRGTGVVEDAE